MRTPGILRTLLILAAVFSLSHAEDVETSDPGTSLSYRDIKNPAKISARMGKPLLIIFYTTWSATYSSMKAGTLSLPAIQEFMSHFHVEFVDAESDKMGVDLKLLYQLNTYPTIVAYSDSGRMGSIRGIWPPYTFLQRLKDWYEIWRSENPIRKSSLPSDPIMGSIGEETRTKKEIRSSGGYQLRTGKILTGTPVKLSSGVVTLVNGDESSQVPLYLFTPESRKIVLAKARSYVFKENNVDAGPHGTTFQEIDGIIEINELRSKLNEPFIVLIDPQQEFQTLLNDYLMDQPMAKNELSYVPKFKIAENLSDRSLNIIYRKYSIEPPAVLIMDKEGVVNQFSEIRLPVEFLAEIKAMRSKAPATEQASLSQ